MAKKISKMLISRRLSNPERHRDRRRGSVPTRTFPLSFSIIRQKVSPERLTFLTCTRYKPSSVPPMEASIIYLRLWSPIASSNLPPDIGRAALNCRYTRSCNPRDAQPRRIATLAVGSYPAFSPLPFRAVIFFYVTIPSRTSSH